MPGARKKPPASPRSAGPRRLVRGRRLTDRLQEIVNAVLRIAASGQVIESVQSSSGQDCGTVDYTWATGDLRPLACMAWSIAYDASQSFSGSVVNDVNFKQDVYVPQWTSPPTVMTQDLDWWRQFIEVIRKHEAGHVDINTQWLPTFRSRMDGQSCSTIDTTGADTRDEIKAAQEAYDKEQYSLQKFPRRPD